MAISYDCPASLVIFAIWTLTIAIRVMVYSTESHGVFHKKVGGTPQKVRGYSTESQGVFHGKFFGGFP